MLLVAHDIQIHVHIKCNLKLKYVSQFEQFPYLRCKYDFAKSQPFQFERSLKMNLPLYINWLTHGRSSFEMFFPSFSSSLVFLVAVFPFFVTEA